MKDIALRTSIEDFVKARDESVRLMEQGIRLLGLAQKKSGEYLRYGFPVEVMPRIGLERAIKEVDQRWWRYCFQFTGLAKLMDEQATKEFERSLEKECPTFSIENIQTMALTMYQEKDALFLRGIFNVFRQLDRNYWTNDRQRFEVQKKSIITWMFDTWWSCRGEYRINHHKRAMVNDIDRCLCVLSNRPYQEYSLETEIHAAIGQADGESTFENEYLKIRGFKNGNGHLWIKESDLLAKINRCIAEYCGPGLADDRVNKSKEEMVA
jgi:hypothetical protein